MSRLLSTLALLAFGFYAQASTVSFIETPIVVMVISGDSVPTFYAEEKVLNQSQLNAWLAQTAKKFGNEDTVYFLCDDRASVESLKAVDGFTKTIYPNRYYILTGFNSQPRAVLPVTEASEAEMAAALEQASLNLAAEPFHPHSNPNRIEATQNWERPLKYFPNK